MINLIIILFINISFPEKSKSIFNGKNLDGWKVYGTEKWYVEEGELVCESGPNREYGYLATKKNIKILF